MVYNLFYQLLFNEHPYTRIITKKKKTLACVLIYKCTHGHSHTNNSSPTQIYNTSCIRLHIFSMYKLQPHSSPQTSQPTHVRYTHALICTHTRAQCNLYTSTYVMHVLPFSTRHSDFRLTSRSIATRRLNLLTAAPSRLAVQLYL